MRVLLAGATGLVGAQALAKLLEDPRVTRVVAPTRRPLAAHPKLENPIGRPDQFEGPVDAAICALGTTMAQAGSRDAFRAVDFDLVLAFARAAKAACATRFALNSSIGADPAASSFYLKVKGEADVAVSALGFDSLTIVRPSLLDGSGRPDARPGEQVALVAAHLFKPLIPKRYRAVPVAAVGACLVSAVLDPVPGTRIISSEAI